MEIDRDTIKSVAHDLDTLLTNLDTLTDAIGTVGTELDRLYALMLDVQNAASVLGCKVHLTLEETEASRALKHARAAATERALALDRAITAAKEDPHVWEGYALGQTSPRRADPL